MTPPDSNKRVGRGWQYLGVGCLTTVAGLFGGGMIGVFVGWIVGHLRRCPAPEGFPICDFFPYWLTGILIGAVLLPTVAIARLRQSDRTRADDERRNTGGAR
jgi:hypothetical protein